MTLELNQSYADSVARARACLRYGNVRAAEDSCAELCRMFEHLPAAFMLYARCAVHRQDWSEALRRWDVCRQRFPDQRSQWAAGRADALGKLDRWNEAEQELVAAVEAGPLVSSHRVALARYLVSRGRPLEAIEQWGEIIRSSQGRSKPLSLLGLAAAQSAAARHGDACDTVRDLLREDPEHRQAMARYVGLLIRLERRAEATTAVTEGPFASPSSDDAMLKRLRLLAWLADLRGARECFDALFTRTVRYDILFALLEFVPNLFEAFDKARIWVALRTRLSGESGRLSSTDVSLAACIELRVAIALRDYSGFLARYATAPSLPAPWNDTFAPLARILGDPAFPDFAAPRVFGIGLSRTGTTTLTAALERLGYFCAHFANPISRDLLAESDFLIFDALTDTPVCHRFETLFYEFPNARFIFTVREPEDWRRSLERYLEHFHGTADFATLARKSSAEGERKGGLEMASMQAALYFNHGDAASAFDAYRRRVDCFFTGARAERLLRFDVFKGDGWPELCAFLKRPQPDGPFPWENRMVAAVDEIGDSMQTSEEPPENS